MDSDTNTDLRRNIITTIVKISKNQPGRTALMKFLFMLQTVKKVPLGYRFRLYTYGPYDGAVRVDIDKAVSDGLLDSEMITHSGGYGYLFSVTEKYDKRSDSIIKAVSNYKDEIDWVVENFGDESASGLELISTIIYAKTERKSDRTSEQLTKRVHEIKPHFSEETIREKIDELDSLLAA